MTENYLNILAETIRNNWDAPALTDFYLTEDGSAQDTNRGNHYTYGEMYAEVCRVAELLTSLGLQKGDHIAICGANSAHWVITYLAIAKMQGVSVTVMHTLMPDEIARLVAFSDAKALFADAELWEELAPLHRPILGDLSFVISLADWSLLSGCSDRAMTERRPRDNRDISFPQSAPDDLAMICFTSGTSGNAKGVMLSYRNITTSVTQTAKAYIEPVIESLSDTNKNAVTYLPLAHAFGWGGNIIPLTYGVKIYLFPSSLTRSEIINTFKLTHPFLVFMVPLILQSIKEEGRLDIFQNLRFLVVGGAQFILDEKKLLEMGVPISLVYGSTETTAPATLSPLIGSRIGSCGRIIDALTAHISPAGEILVKGENVMLGYYKDPEATTAKIDADGWLHTGDKGHLDEDGYLYVEGRLEQDIIVLPNGENIRPDHIESLINALPEVKESIVLARDGKLVAIVVADPQPLPARRGDDLRRTILRAVNPQLPLFSQLYDVEITDVPLQRTEKQTIKRYLYS